MVAEMEREQLRVVAAVVAAAQQDHYRQAEVEEEGADGRLDEAGVVAVVELAVVELAVVEVVPVELAVVEVVPVELAVEVPVVAQLGLGLDHQHQVVVAVVAVAVAYEVQAHQPQHVVAGHSEEVVVPAVLLRALKVQVVVVPGLAFALVEVEEEEEALKVP